MGKAKNIVLTPKQLKFVEAYTGNACEAARQAGYRGSDHILTVIGNENIRKPYLIQAIRDKEKNELKPLIASRAERQKFWSEVMSDPDVEMPHRLKASELLGRSNADFIERRELLIGSSIRKLVVGIIADPGSDIEVLDIDNDNHEFT